MRCTICADAPTLLPTGAYGRSYCPACKRIHTRHGATDQSYVPPAPAFELQPKDVLPNPAFRAEVPAVTVVPRTLRDKAPLPVLEKGFDYRPLVHFVWMGTPESHQAFAPVMKWAATLSEGWGPICLWVDADCMQKLVPTIACVAKCSAPIEACGQRLEPCYTLTKTGCVPVQFVSIDEHLARLAKGNDVLTKLAAAIDFERQHKPPLRLVQVASDIYRIIVLRHYGGAYFDFDVEPSLRCGSRGFLAPKLVPLGKAGLLCHAKPGSNFSENDIIFANPACEGAASALERMLLAMARNYDKPEARCKWLEKHIELAFRDAAPAVLEKYWAGMAVKGSTVLKLAYLVEQDLHRGSKVEYPKALDTQVADLCRLVSQSVEAFTFTAFQQQIDQTSNAPAWREMEACFSDATLTKPFYSWGDPGASASIKALDAIETVQAEIRMYLAQKEAAGRRAALRRMLELLADLRVTDERRLMLAHSWLDDIERDYGHLPSVQEIDAWIYLHWPD